PPDRRRERTRGGRPAGWPARVWQGELARVLREYGEEPRAGSVASAIIRARDAAPLTTTTALADAVVRAAGRGKPKIHPATRVFQAIRIAINRELDALESALGQAEELLAPGGRLAIISFHSLEDRIVKRYFARAARGDPRYAGLPSMPPAARPTLKLCGRLIRPTPAEIARNPRSRSARLRIAEKLPAQEAA